jgi:DNA-binding transcriptional MerR regulator
MPLMTIGEFAARTRLSAKALRLYDELNLVVPARVDPGSGYRFYTADQVEQARLVADLRRADMPLALISSVLAMTGPDAAGAIASWWAELESNVAERRALVSHLQARLRGEEPEPARYDIQVRSLPQRSLLAISRHLHIGATGQFFADAFARLRAAGPGLEGIAGVPFLIFYGEVSHDSDGPLELCRPVAAGAQPGPDGDVQLRSEPAHEEAYIRLALEDMGWPALRPACEALEHWVAAQQRRAAGALRQVLIADQRTAAPRTPVCDLTVPLR